MQIGGCLGLPIEKRQAFQFFSTKKQFSPEMDKKNK